MAKRLQLFLYEEIMLLALRDREGTIATQYLNQVIAGAVLAELLLEGRVAVSADRKQMLDVANATPLGDPIVDESLNVIRAAARRSSLKTWVDRISELKHLSQNVARQLV